MRNSTLLVQTTDLEQEVRSTCQKIVDMSDAYTGLIEHADQQLNETMAEKHQMANNFKYEMDVCSEQLSDSQKLIESL
jgi:hypothetical protein